jgi:hypothetical protein
MGLVRFAFIANRTRTAEIDEQCIKKNGMCTRTNENAEKVERREDEYLHVNVRNWQHIKVFEMSKMIDGLVQTLAYRFSSTIKYFSVVQISL